MFNFFSLNILIISIIGTIFFTGCSHKYFRSKPTTYINLNKENKDYNISLLSIKCINADENSTKVDKIGKCSDYLTADISQVSFLNIDNNNATEKKKMYKLSNDLFYVADRNCKKFQEKFFYNLFMEDNANQFLGLNLFGIGIGVDFKKLSSISHSQFAMLNENLNKNLEARKNLKISIYNNISKDNNYTTEKLLVDIIEYDKSCSLFNTK